MLGTSRAGTARLTTYLLILLQVVFFLSILRTTAIAAVSQEISFQGKIVDKTNGTNISPSCVIAGAGNDTCDIRVGIYSNVSGGSALWSEIHTDVEIGQYTGVFSLSIGSFCITNQGGSWTTDGDAGGSRCAVTGGGVDWGADDSLYLQIEFDAANTSGENSFASPETFSRKLLTSVPFALRAATVDGVPLTGLVQLAPDSVQTTTDTDSLINLQTTGNTSNALLRLVENGGGTPNFIRLIQGSSDQFIVTNSGNIQSVAGAKWQSLTNSVTGLQVANAAGTAFVNFDTLNQRVGIGNSAPVTALDVTGTAKIGGFNEATAGTCNGTVEGAMFYDNVDKIYKFCDGTSWRWLGGVAFNTKTIQTRTVICTKTLTSSGILDTANDCGGLAANYDSLEINLKIRTTAAAIGYDDVYMYFNNDTTNTNYRFSLTNVLSGTASSGAGDLPLIGRTTDSNADSGAFGVYKINLPKYNSSQLKTALIDWGTNIINTADINGFGALTWQSTSAITRIAIRPDGFATDNFVTGSTFEIVGIKEESVVTNITNTSHNSANDISFKAHRNGVNQTGIAHQTFTKIDWTNEEFDTRQSFDLANDRFQPAIPGKYVLTGSVAVLLNIANTGCYASIYKNGTLYASGSYVVAGGTGNCLSNVSAIVEANGTTDYFELYIWQQTGVNRDVDGAINYTHFEGSALTTRSNAGTSGGINGGLYDKHKQTNTTDATVVNQVVRKGWGYIQGNNTVAINKTTSYGIAFDNVPVVLVSFNGFVLTTPPTDATGCTGEVGGNLGSFIYASDVTVSNFRMNIEASGSSFTNASYYCYTWLAIGSSSAQYGADLAEYYRTFDKTIEAGDVVSVDKDNDISVVKSNRAYDYSVMGVIATNPGITLGSADGTTPGVRTSLTGEDIHNGDATSVRVALSGRVPVKVTLENGIIKRGDPLTSSSRPGYAMKATGNGVIIGRALENFDGSSGTVALLEKAKGELTTEQFAQFQFALNTEEGKVMTYVQNGGYNWGEDSSTINPIANVLGANIEEIPSYQGNNSVTYASSNGKQLLTANLETGNLAIGGEAGTDKLTVYGNLRIGTTETLGCIKDSSGVGIAGACATSSDIASNTNELGNILDKLKQLKPVRYSLTEQNKIRYGVDAAEQIGLLAENVESVFPSLVGKDEFGNKTVNYGVELQTYLLKAILEQDEKLSLLGVQTNDAIAKLNNNSNLGALASEPNEEFKSMSSYIGALQSGKGKITVTEAIVTGSFTVQGQLNLGADTIGTLKVVTGEGAVEYKFAKAYGKAPVVIVAPVNYLGVYTLTDITTEGFVIKLGEKATEDIVFNWFAAASAN